MMELAGTLQYGALLMMELATTLQYGALLTGYISQHLEKHQLAFMIFMIFPAIIN
jgi:hypothetical protein